MSRRIHGAPAFVATAAALFVASACQSVLGIEELSSEGADDSPRTGGRSSDGGEGGVVEPSSGGAAVGGMPTTGGNGVAGAEAGAGGAEGGTPPDVAGAAGEGGAGTPIGGAGGEAGGDGGSGGTAPTGITVTGRVINFYRQPLENVPVSIGDQLGTTDADGAFTFDDVTTPYDLAVVVVGDGLTEGWLYRGLTRPNPTVQSYFYPFVSSYGYFDFTFQSSGGVDANEYLYYSFGFGALGQYQSYTQEPTGSLSSSASWYGSGEVSGTLHFLRWTPETPKFTSYGSQPVTLEDAGTVMAQLNLGSATAELDTDQITGIVLGVEDWESRENNLSLAFPSGATIQLYEDAYPTTDTFQFTVPSAEDARVTLVATSDDCCYPYALVHRRGIAPGEVGIELTLPPVAVPTLPVADAEVSADTTFSWNGPDVAYQFRAIFFGEARNIVFNVVTVEKSAQFPDFSNMGLTFPAAADGSWLVEYHGPYQSVDDAAHTQGMLEPYNDFGDLTGIDDRDGVRAISQQRNFVTP